jgi:hypothetical protein
VVNARVQLLAPSFAIFSFIRPGTRAENATQSLPYFVTASVSFVSSSTVDLPIVRLRFGFKICVHLLQHCSLVGFKNITATATQSLPYFCTPSTRFASSSAFHYPSPCGQCQGPKNLPIYYDTLHSFDLEPALQLQSNCCGVALPPQSACAFFHCPFTHGPVVDARAQLVVAATAQTLPCLCTASMSFASSSVVQFRRGARGRVRTL